MVSVGIKRKRGQKTQTCSLGSGGGKVSQSDLVRYESQRDNVYGVTEMN